MSVESRVKKLERRRDERDERVRFRVIVPRKLTREEWQRKCRETGRTGARRGDDE